MQDKDGSIKLKVVYLSDERWEGRDSRRRASHRGMEAGAQQHTRPM